MSSRVKREVRMAFEVFRRAGYRGGPAVAVSVVFVVGAGLVAGCRSAEPQALPVAAAPSASGATPVPSSAPPSTSPEPRGRPTATADAAIPDAVLLRPGDLGGAEVSESDLGYWRDGGRIPPRPCTGGEYPSDTRRTAERAVQAMVAPPPGQEGTPNVVVEYVARYRAGGAAAFMTELRAALARCPGAGTVRSPAWAVLGKADTGDDSLLVRLTYVGGYDGDPDIRTEQYFAVVRIGRVILVLASVGWEISSGDVTAARTLAHVAAKRLRPLA
jgi:hypothetical protein